ncbi:TetR/AcrR family transcriptional regulator [Paenibacillus daejeonensis]|uniref:TetR/AcrR family transcriptional regulator n=1 Tax=Paenibacillus daejeonensis TaxID=135193 RepID=UPI00037B4695|nr:TetR/AcrR family transcriptional regulator [Paenibacillus daejeonensis]
MKKKDLTAQQLVEAAFELFAEHGLEKTSLGMIADKVGMTKPSIYYHFSSKEALVQGVFEHLFRDHTFAAYFSTDNLDPVSFATKLYEGGLHMMPPPDQSQHAILRVIHEYTMLAQRDVVYRTRINGMQQDFLAGFHQLLQVGVELGVVRASNPQLKAYVLAMVIDNISRNILMQMDMDYPGIWREAVNQVLEPPYHIQ